MIPAVVTAGFFLAITVALQFSSWAEGWLASNADPSRNGRPTRTSVGGPGLLARQRTRSGSGSVSDATQRS